MAKSGKEKMLSKLIANAVPQAAMAIEAPKRNDARMTIRVEKKMVDGKETEKGCSL